MNDDDKLHNVAPSAVDPQWHKGKMSLDKKHYFVDRC